MPCQGFKWHEYFGHVTCPLDDLSCSTDLITSACQIHCRERSAALLSAKQNAFIHCDFNDVFVLFSELWRQITERQAFYCFPRRAKAEVAVMVWACQSNTQNMEAGELGDWDHLDYIVRPILKKKIFLDCCRTRQGKINWLLTMTIGSYHWVQFGFMPFRPTSPGGLSGSVQSTNCPGCGGNYTFPHSCSSTSWTRRLLKILNVGWNLGWKRLKGRLLRIVCNVNTT